MPCLPLFVIPSSLFLPQGGQLQTKTTAHFAVSKVSVCKILQWKFSFSGF